MKVLLKHLAPLKKKMIVKLWLEATAFFLSLGFVCSGVLLMAAKFCYIENLWLLLAGIMVICLLLGVIAVLMKRPDSKAVAVCGDRLGFKERFVTALEVMENKDAASALAVQDAVASAESADFKQLYKISVRKHILLALVCSLGFMCITGFVPSPVPEKLAQERELQLKIAEQARILEEQKDSLLKEAAAKDVAAIEKILKDMSKELKAAKTEADAVKATKKAQEELTKLSKDSVHKDLKDLGEKLQRHEATRELGQAIESGNTQDMAANMERLNNALATATEEERNAIADALRETAEEIARDNALKDNLNALSDSVNSGNLGDLGDQIKAFNDALNQMAASDANLQAAIDQYKEALSNASQDLQGQQEQNDGNSSQGQSAGEKKQSDNNGAEGAGQGGNQGQDGSGNGEGQGQGGSGEGEGQGSARGSGHKENENIYSRDAAGQQDQALNIEGTMNEDGEILTQNQKTLGEAGESIPYGRVYEQYKQEALNSLEDYEIPYGMREIVRDYFSALD